MPPTPIGGPYAQPPGPLGGPAYHVPGGVDPTAGGIIHATHVYNPSLAGQMQATALHGAGYNLGQALVNHLTRVDPGVYGLPGQHPGPTGPPVQAPPGLPYGYPNLQALVDYMRGIY
jgi:hypothetical protein